MKSSLMGFGMISIIVFFSMSSCDELTTPKPRGYYRIALPTKEYTVYQSPCNFQFDVPNYTKLEMVKNDSLSDSCWFNLVYPKLNAKLYCTYSPIHDNFDLLVRDAYVFASKHEVRASALKRTQINYPDKDIYGILYDIEGDAASQLQFFLSDSTNHFFRGSLYFYNPPNPDSIAPVLAFIREDVMRITQSMEWSK